MKKMYYLINNEFKGLYRVVLVLVLVLIILQQFLLIRSIKYYPNRFERFELLFSKSGCIIIFLVCFFALCGLCIFNAYSNYTESKSIYTLLTLPLPREYMYFSKLISYSMCFLTLLASQIISAWIGYGLFYWYVSSQQIATNITLPVNNGLFLAFIRSDFFRLILPFGFMGFISSLAVFISLVCTIYYGVICERSKRYFRFAIVILNLSLIVLSLVHRINSLTVLGVYESNYIHVLTAAIFLTTVFIIYDSLRLIKKSAIV
ncbi:MAG: hypothetical protein GX213_14525 [Clostridiaceae bacterium]|nr:hypothetical protein [Clostridiaceae bacterium]